MDQRITLGKGESFINMLTECWNNKQVVALLYDDQGLARAGGLIKKIVSIPSGFIIRLQSGLRLDISKIVAVNGVFLDSYSEC